MLAAGCGSGDSPPAGESPASVELTAAAQRTFEDLRAEVNRVDGSLSGAAAASAAEMKQLLDEALSNDSISVVDMFRLQMLMNRLSQLSEMSGSIMSASNSAIMSLARNVKG
jgi:hypothetical protein